MGRGGGRGGCRSRGTATGSRNYSSRTSRQPHVPVIALDVGPTNNCGAIPIQVALTQERRHGSENLSYTQAVPTMTVGELRSKLYTLTAFEPARQRLHITLPENFDIRDFVDRQELPSPAFWRYRRHASETASGESMLLYMIRTEHLALAYKRLALAKLVSTRLCSLPALNPDVVMQICTSPPLDTVRKLEIGRTFDGQTFEMLGLMSLLQGLGSGLTATDEEILISANLPEDFQCTLELSNLDHLRLTPLDAYLARESHIQAAKTRMTRVNRQLLHLYRPLLALGMALVEASLFSLLGDIALLGGIIGVLIVVVAAGGHMTTYCLRLMILSDRVAEVMSQHNDITQF